MEWNSSEPGSGEAESTKGTHYRRGFHEVWLGSYYVKNVHGISNYIYAYFLRPCCCVAWRRQDQVMRLTEDRLRGREPLSLALSFYLTVAAISRAFRV
jgi:hypothetical protein